MAAPTLDRARPFGTISGDDLGRCFEQDGRFFRADGTLWAEPVNADQTSAETVTPAKPPKRGKASAEPLDAQLDAQLGAA